MNSPASPQLLYRKVDCPIMYFELKRQSHFAELVIDVFDPILEPLRGKASHVAKNHLAHKIVHHLPLAFGKGMHRAHEIDFSKINALQYFKPRNSPRLYGRWSISELASCDRKYVQKPYFFRKLGY